MDIHPILLVRSFYLFTAAALLAASLIPALRKTLLSYGPRSAPPSSGHHPMATRSKTPTKVKLSKDNVIVEENKLLKRVVGPSVPHRWFLHFYAFAVFANLLWLAQLITNGRLLRLLGRLQSENAPISLSMNIETVALVWALFLIHVSRRLYESVYFLKPSSSKMLLVQYILGILYYATTSVAVWVEGLPALKKFGRLTLQDLDLVNFSLPSMFGVLLFILSSGLQYDCHTYLASLEKYTRPVHPIFNTVICPHYMAECLIYLSLAIIAAPEGAWLNQTLLACLAFVVVNLGITAESTRAWYVTKFGPESVSGKPRMIPFIF